MRTGKVILFIFLVLTACETAKDFPLPEENYFVKYYGGAGNQEGVDFVVNSDGTVVLLGNSRGPGGFQQMYVAKVTTDGAVVWERYLGLPNNNDFAKDIELHPDGRIIIAGETEITPGDRDVYLKSISQEGTELDSLRMPSLGPGSDEEVSAVTILSDGGFIITGSTTYVTSGQINDTKDGLQLRFDSNFVIADNSWTKTRGIDDSQDVTVKAFQVSPNEYHFFGYTNTIRKSSRDFKFWVFTISGTGGPLDNGVVLFDTLGSTLENEILTSVIKSPIQSGEGYILSGVASSVIGESRSYVVKLSNLLNTIEKSDFQFQLYPTTLGNNTKAPVKVNSLVAEKFIMLTNENATSNNGGYNLALTRLKRDLTKDWSTPLQFGGAYDDFAGSVAELPNGRLLVIGTMTLGNGGQTKMVLMKLNPDGKLDE